jgi:DNA mismatch repair protein MutS
MDEGGGRTPSRDPSVDRPPAAGLPFESISQDSGADPIAAPGGAPRKDLRGPGAAVTPPSVLGEPAEASKRVSGADVTPPSAPSERADAASRVSGADTTPQSAPGAALEEAPRGPGADVTPMMRQYRDWKRRYPDYLLLFRLGDFYEAFYEDAATAARLLGIALTSRQKGEGAIPMAGVPHHAVETYIARLIRAGHKVAVCDQVEAAPVKGRKLIRREVVRLVTPGTVTESGLLDASVNTFLGALVRAGDRLGVALIDVTAAEFWVGESADTEGLAETVALRRPAEVLVPPTLAEADPVLARLRAGGTVLTTRPASAFGLREAEERLRRHFGVVTLDGLGLGEWSAAVRAAAAALDYLQETQQASPTHLTKLQVLTLDDHLALDESAVRTLELIEALPDRGPQGSLLWALDRTVTPMGSRLLRQWLLRPLRRPAEIGRRLDAVAALEAAPDLTETLRQHLRLVGDLARLASRVALGVASPRDLAALRAGLRPLHALRGTLGRVDDPVMREAGDQIEDLEALAKTLEAALVDEPPLSPHEGGLIREAYSPALAELREEVRQARTWIAGLETRERERTGIPTLRVRFNRVFGYGIEVSKSHTRLVPAEYVRRQTLVGAERYVTPELREQEGKVLGAEGRRNRLEFDLFDELRRGVAAEADRLLRTSRALALLDVLAGFAHVARERGYVRPRVDDSPALEIRAGRHPVLELATGGAPFVPNDLVLDGESVAALVITGPNMAGKSTYMRQAALIVLLAQAGSFVPARSARIGVVDRVFTRIGAHDNLSRGQSTFLVEMTETAQILRHATPKSLVLLDEIGRGTSTFDGLAIAWAVAEHLHERCAGAKVLFATHYHELTRLAAELPRVRNVHVTVREWRDGIVFLHTVAPGGTDRSYGIQVARLAGLPDEVVARARALLREFEGGTPTPAPPAGMDTGQLSMFGAGEPAALAAHPVLEALAALDPHRMTPLEALTTLADLVRRAREGG